MTSQELLNMIEERLNAIIKQSTYVEFGSGSKRKDLLECLHFEYKNFKVTIEILKK